MSDIVVRGLEPPKKCRHGECTFACSAAYHTGLICVALNRYVPGGEIPEYCPAHELPPHGDLIDRDALYKSEGRYIISNGKEGIDIDEIARLPVIVPHDQEEPWPI